MSSDIRHFAKVKANGFVLQQNVFFEVGTTGLRIPLSASGEMRINPGPIDPILAARITGELVHRGSGSKHEVKLTRPQLIGHLLAGEYSLDVRLGAAVILSIAGLVVPEAGQCSDPRLNLHLEDLVGKRRLRLFPEPQRTVDVYLKPAGASGWTHLQVYSNDGWIEFPCATGISTRQLVRAEGTQPTDVTATANGFAVSMSPLLEVTLRFKGAPPPAKRLFFLTPTGPLGELPNLGETICIVGSDGSATALVPGLGDYKCQFNSSPLDEAGPWSNLEPITINGPEVTIQAAIRDER